MYIRTTTIRVVLYLGMRTLNNLKLHAVTFTSWFDIFGEVCMFRIIHQSTSQIRAGMLVFGKLILFDRTNIYNFVFNMLFCKPSTQTSRRSSKVFNILTYMYLLKMASNR